MTRIECESRRQAEAIRDRLLLKLPRGRSVGTLPATGPNVKRWATYVDATKDEVRDEAARRGFFRVAGKQDSQEICFVQSDYREFLRERLPADVDALHQACSTNCTRSPTVSPRIPSRSSPLIQPTKSTRSP